MESLKRNEAQVSAPRDFCSASRQLDSRDQIWDLELLYYNIVQHIIVYCRRFSSIFVYYSQGLGVWVGFWGLFFDGHVS